MSKPKESTVPPDKVILREAAYDGAAIGMKNGFFLPVYYSFGIAVINLVITLGTDFENIILAGSVSSIAILFGSALLFFGIFGSVIGIVPGVAIGIITGFLLGGLITWKTKELTSIKALILGGLFGMSVAILLFILYFDWSGYWFLVGLPSIAYTLACAWMSMKFYQERVAGEPSQD